MSVVANSLAACFPAPAQAESQYPLPQYTQGASVPASQRADGARHRPGQVRGFSWRRLVSSYWTDWLLILCLW